MDGLVRGYVFFRVVLYIFYILCFTIVAGFGIHGEYEDSSTLIDTM